MDNSGNFILKVHIQDNDLKEIFLNKENRCFSFFNDECVADLVLPEFKLTSLKVLVKNVASDKKNDNYYAEYNDDGQKVYEYDRDKVKLLSEMVTNITVADFLEFIDRTKQNDFYIDNIVDIYNATIPEEVKRLVSYTTNGFKFNESDIRMLAHEEILDSDFRKDKFIPIFECNNTFFGYDLNERKYARYVDGSVYKFYDSLNELLDLDSKEEVEDDSIEDKKIDVVIEKNEKDEEKVLENEINNDQEIDSDEEESLFNIITKEETEKRQEEIKKENDNNNKVLPETPVVESEDDIKNETTEEDVENRYDDIISNINTQFERLNTQIESIPEPSNPYEMDIDSLFSNYKIEIPKSVYKNDLDRLYKESQLEMNHLKETNPYKMDIDSLFSNYKIEKVSTKNDETNEEKELQSISNEENINKKDDVSVNKTINSSNIKHTNYQLGKENLFKDIDSRYKLNNAKFNVDKKDLKNSKKDTNQNKEYLLGKFNLFKDKSRYKLNNSTFEIKKSDVKTLGNDDEQEFVVTKDLIDDIRESVRKSLKKLEKEELAELDLERLIDNSLLDSINNHRINYNDSMKLVVEHIPYYQNDNSFGVVQIPELEVKKYTLLPGISLDFDRIKFKVLKLTEEKLELLIEKATNISDESGDKIKKGDIVKMDSTTELIYLLDKKDAMESWTFRMEKTVYEKELRRLEYSKLLKSIKNKTNYETLANIEKYETQKSIMLFIDLISKNDEINKLDELYNIINNKGNYARFITEYNNNQAHNDKDSLPSYDHKKEFLEKLKYVNTLISTNAITYPRYIYSSFNYFDGEQILEDYLEDINKSLRENDFSNYLKGLFKQNEVFTKLDEVGKYNLNKCLDYISSVYKHNPSIGEEEKYKIENTLIITSEDEDLALLVSKLCRKGIKDYDIFKEYDSLIKEEYRTGNLKYPLYSENFDIEEVRKGGEYDEI